MPVPELIQFLIDHVVFPPKLPHEDDSERSSAVSLIQVFNSVAHQFARQGSDDVRLIWTRVAHSMASWGQVYDGDILCEKKVAAVIAAMQVDSVLLLHVQKQNACLLLRKTSTATIFECFEASPRTEDVMAANAALIRTFPAKAVEVPRQKMQDENFIKELASALHRLSVEHLEIASEKSYKAGSFLVEERQSCHPRLVTEWVIGVLLSVGNPTITNSITKRTHDDVCWNNSRLPWRRSPLLLGLKVAVQLTLLNTPIADSDHSQYKSFMLCLVASLGRKLIEHAVPLDILQVICAKMARRSSKLGSFFSGLTMATTFRSMRKIRVHMITRWSEIQNLGVSNMPSLPSSDKCDFTLQLARSSTHLERILSRSRLTYSYPSTPFQPPQFSGMKFLRETLPVLQVPSCDTDDVLSTLVAFESWAVESLPLWAKRDVVTDSDCVRLTELIARYYKLASSCYKNDPEQNSIMLLTIVELWLALDTTAARLYPLLSGYSPEISVAMFEPLLLPQLRELERLKVIEDYLTRRHQHSIREHVSIFGALSQTSLSVRYFNRSTRLQQLRKEIEDDATKRRERKTTELQTLQAEYASLMNRVNVMVHDNYTNRQGRTGHSRYCNLCRVQRQAHDLQIEKHEWPLPEDELSCKAAVFELSPPIGLCSWRDACWMIVQDVGKRSSTKGVSPNGKQLLYSPLSEFRSETPRRLVFASIAKSFMSAHYKVMSITMSQVTVNHGMRYRLYDGTNGLWTEEQLGVPSLRSYCVSEVPPGPYHCLKDAINSTTHSQNDILAKQALCSKELSIHEFIAVGSLRAGERLQWLNILRELGASETNFNSNVVLSLIQQAAWQAGTPLLTSTLREAHVPFEDLTFCLALLKGLTSNLLNIEANWKEVHSASVLLLISQRLLSLTLHKTIKQDVLKQILKVRKTALGWTQQLLELFREQRDVGETSSEALSEYEIRILEVVLLARSTWNVDIRYLDVLLRTEIDIADYVQSSILVHDYKAICGNRLCSQLQRAVLKDRKLSMFLSDKARKLFSQSNGGITLGIRRLWSGANFGGLWKTVPSNESFLVNHTCNQQQKAHYNFVSGELLVAGRPLGLLPEAYIRSPIYQAIFGSRVLDVVTSDLLDMAYVTTRCFAGHQFYFGLRDSELLIRTKNGVHMFEAVPSDHFAGDVPAKLIESSIQWMNLGNQQVEFRSRKPWTSTQEDWVIHFNKAQPALSTMLQAGRCLVDAHSTVGGYISTMFQNLEQPRYIHISWVDKARLEVELPRYRLKFFANASGEVECRELSAVIDKNQRLGTLYGLQNYLVLRATGVSSSQLDRIVLIPSGTVKITKQGLHVRVDVDTASIKQVAFFQYKIDVRLGQLLAEGNVEAQLYKSYLHAITSSPLPDELTGRTGTAESMMSLADQITRTSMPLSKDAQTALQDISGLTPVRKFYPPNLKKMQQVTWSSVLSPYTQHDQFLVLTEEILEHNRQPGFLYAGSSTPARVYNGDLQLLERAVFRNAKFYALNVSGIPHSLPSDKVYKSRDREESSAQLSAYEIATLVESWPSRLQVRPGLYSRLQDWGSISGFLEIFCKSSLSDLLEVDLEMHWPSLYSLCRSCEKDKDQYRLLFLFSAIAFGSTVSTVGLCTLLAFATNGKLKAIEPPTLNAYDLQEGHEASRNDVQDLLSGCAKSFVSTSNSAADRERDEISYKKKADLQKTTLIDAIMNCWPRERPQLPNPTLASHFDLTALKPRLEAKFRSWYNNRGCYLRIQAIEVQLRLINFPIATTACPRSSLEPRDVSRNRPGDGRHTLSELVHRNGAKNWKNLLGFCKSGYDGCMKVNMTTKKYATESEILAKEDELRELLEILNKLSHNGDHTDRAYAKSLLSSVEALRTNIRQNRPKKTLAPSLALRTERDNQETNVKRGLHHFRTILGPETNAERMVQGSGLWPSITYLSLLGLVSDRRRENLSVAWVHALVAFASEITALQRIERLSRYQEAGNSFAMQKEVENEAHDLWNPTKHPDWLLIEIQNNILLRPIQVRVAEEILKPTNGVLQLMMGEGKTSVILPMVITALADGQKLVRVVVLKPLLTEMLHTLAFSLSGLVGRPVYHLPFSRQTVLTNRSTNKLLSLFKQCREVQGVLLTLPEHLNSFRLMGWDSLQLEDREFSQTLLEIQKWLDDHTRDVLDESDELLGVGWELVYTVGSAKPMSDSPDRWLIAQELLSLVGSQAALAHSQCHTGIEYESSRTGAFPHIRILNDQGAKTLMNLLLQAIDRGNLSRLSTGHCSSELRKAVQKFISVRNVDAASCRVVQEHFEGSTEMQTLFLLRGMFANEILKLSLQKRWMVQYGLRGGCLSSVPYRAKSVPAQSAEFAQADLMILLTALTYYFGGLSLEDFNCSATLLMKTVDPEHEYATWVKGSMLPPKLRSLNAVNLDNQLCMNQLFAHLRYQKTTVDFFLSHVVYQREAKEFNYKLSTSSWDLCSVDTQTITSGFSGTNDNKSLLPLSISQKDLEELKDTNAIVLAALMRPENAKYICTADAKRRRLSTKHLLDVIVKQDPRPCVLIDVGAQVLDLTNQELASAWLSLRQDKQAVVFYNGDDERMVLNEDGSLDAWRSSPFRDRLEACLIVLDQSHTRGTDFQLPDGYAAAVTLGPGLTKDTFSQAVMRMRKLGATQSILTFSPPEVDDSIRSLVGKPLECTITIVDVIRWLFAQTCAGIRSLSPLFVVRGMAHSKRRFAEWAYLRSSGSVQDARIYFEAIKERESKPVSEMYAVPQAGQAWLPYEFNAREQRDTVVQQLLLDVAKIDSATLQDSGKQEEQEREVLHEVEQERQVERPSSYPSRDSKVSSSLLPLVRSGIVPSFKDPEILPAFSLLLKTSAKRRVDLIGWGRGLLATKDFCQTIKLSRGSMLDDFLRPANWIMSSKHTTALYLISPHEANELLPEIRESEHVTLHVYAPKVSKSMPSFDNLDYYCIPPLNLQQVLDLNNKLAVSLFAGQLYMSGFPHYTQLCHFLGIIDGVRVLEDNGMEIAADGFVSAVCRLSNGWESRFQKSPVSFVKELINMRRKGLDFGHTHIGRMLGGKLLRASEFQ